MIILLVNCVADMIILELLVCGWCWRKLVHPVSRLTVDWSCHSLLLVRLFIDAFTLFFKGIVWLGNLGAWLGIFTNTYLHTLLWNGLSYIHSKTGVTHIYGINHIHHAIGKDLSDLLMSTPSVRHTNGHRQAGPLPYNMSSKDEILFLILRFHNNFYFVPMIILYMYIIVRVVWG